MVRNPKLAPLTERLTPHQQFTRRQKMHARGTMREQIHQTHNIMKYAFTQVGANARRQNRINYALMGVLTLMVVGLAGRVFGWW